MKSYIAYPGDQPPQVAELPDDYDFSGHLWSYVPATPDAAAEAVAVCREQWAEWGVDPALVALAKG